MKKTIRLIAFVLCCVCVLMLSACKNDCTSISTVNGNSPSNTTTITIGDITVYVNINQAFGEGAMFESDTAEPEFDNEDTSCEVTINKSSDKLKAKPIDTTLQ